MPQLRWKSDLQRPLLACFVAFAATSIGAGAGAAPARPIGADSGLTPGRAAELERPSVRVSDPDDAAGRLDIARLRARQVHRRIELEIVSRHRFAVLSLHGHPDFDPKHAQQYLCLATRAGGEARRACLGPSGNGEPRLYQGIAGAGGVVAKWSLVGRATITRPDRRSVSLKLPYAAIGAEPGRLRLRVLSAWSEGICAPAEPEPRRGGFSRAQDRRAAAPIPEEPCADAAPDDSFATIKLIEPRLVGCRARSLDPVRSGPEGRRRIALTFDDGPSSYTDSVLDILEDRSVHATFFMVGTQVSADPQEVRSVLAAGHEIGNHSTSHSVNPSRSDIAETQRRIDAASGYRPCLFRPPYGSLGAATLAAARDLRLQTVTWNIDTRDWTQPGSDAIRAEALSEAKPGAIILMHDGGGPRSQTIAALPGIIRGLRDRGYKLMTVGRLLGNRRVMWP